MAIPDNTRQSLRLRLRERGHTRWPELTEVRLRFRADFAYVDGVLADGDVVNLCRLRYLRRANEWGFAIYLYSRESYEDSVLPTGSFAGTPEEALDCACGLYLNDPSAWTP
ncbi:MAG: hypothetical protein WD627_12500 [Actinomycetota bacterium]